MNNAIEHRLQEISRFSRLLKQEFPFASTEMAKDITRGGRVTESTTRIVCRFPDFDTLRKAQTRFYARRMTKYDDTTLIFIF